MAIGTVAAFAIVHMSALAALLGYGAWMLEFAAVELETILDADNFIAGLLAPCHVHQLTPVASLYRFCEPDFEASFVELPALMVLEAAHIGYWLSDKTVGLGLGLGAAMLRSRAHEALRQLHCMWVDRFYARTMALLGSVHSVRRLRATPGVPLPTNSKVPA